MPAQLLYRLLLYSFYWTVGIFVIWWVLNGVLSGIVWTGMTVSQSALIGEYCEFDQVNQFFRQPVNTYSNLAYFFLGVFIILLAQRDYQNGERTSVNRLEAFPLLSAFVGLCFVYLAFGSAFFHASLTYVGQRVDMNGTYAVLIALIGMALYHILYAVRLTAFGQILWVLFLLLIIIAFLPLWAVVPSARLVPALILLLTLIMIINFVQFRRSRSFLFVILSFTLVVIAVKIRMLDVQKVNCDPYSFFQGHAWWHVLTGLSSFCSYAFFRFTGVANDSTLQR